MGSEYAPPFLTVTITTPAIGRFARKLGVLVVYNSPNDRVKQQEKNVAPL